MIRDAPLGQLIRLVTRNRVLQYPEEKPDFQLPDTWLQVIKENESPSAQSQVFGTRRSSTSSTSRSTSPDEENQVESGYEKSERLELARTKTRESTTPYTKERLEADEQHELEKTKSIPIVPRKTRDGNILVDWYYTDDPENPQNWSNLRRAMITAVICLYTFIVYMSSAIYTTSEQESNGGIRRR